MSSTTSSSNAGRLGGLGRDSVVLVPGTQSLTETQKSAVLDNLLSTNQKAVLNGSPSTGASGKVTDLGYYEKENEIWTWSFNDEDDSSNESAALLLSELNKTGAPKPVFPSSTGQWTCISPIDSFDDGYMDESDVETATANDKIVYLWFEKEDIYIYLIASRTSETSTTLKKRATLAIDAMKRDVDDMYVHDSECRTKCIAMSRISTTVAKGDTVWIEKDSSGKWRLVGYDDYGFSSESGDDVTFSHTSDIGTNYIVVRRVRIVTKDDDPISVSAVKNGWVFSDGVDRTLYYKYDEGEDNYRFTTDPNFKEDYSYGHFYSDLQMPFVESITLTKECQDLYDEVQITATRLTTAYRKDIEMRIRDSVSSIESATSADDVIAKFNSLLSALKNIGLSS